ncbi:DUF190 domain-containing protein [Castellaniella caeni]|uniref:DUF190 domain-containing protein n=1 Tax=Castellaniella caeni TaxID=266123 RepID=UPI00082DDEEA|nr:DUF190 domain-containing protein [Castellaniella caeni]
MKKGYEILFMAPRSQRHKGKPTLDAVIEIARQHNIHRYTRRVDTESIGRDGRAHAAHFFELVDEPEELLFVLGAHRANELLQALEAERMHVFCVRRTIDFGHLDESGPDEQHP